MLKENIRMIKAFVLIFSLNPLFGFSQPDKKCNIELITIAYQNATKLTESECLGFLLTIDPVCENNVEFGEFSNEALFKILENSPLVLIKTIELNKSSIHLEIIYDMIQNPLHDRIDLNCIRIKILELNYTSSVISDIIKNLDIAIAKM
jgi:hypothetical protein